MNPPRPKEKDVQAGILEYLAVRGAFATRINSGAVKGGGRFVRFNNRPGCSDLLVCYRGRFLALEVKRDRKGKATAHQNRFLDDVKQVGRGVGEVVAGIEDVAAILDRIDTELEGRA